MLALLCGGQGRVSAEMFDLTAAEPEARAIFDAATRLLGQDPRSLVRQAEHDQLVANRTNQLLSVTAALAVHACIEPVLPSALAVTGYSVGEMASCCIAGIWSPETVLHLTDCRAQAMDAADGATGDAGGQLGYVRGLDRSLVEALAAEHHCVVAIVNPANLFVLGGGRADILALCRAAEQAGAVRAALLDVRIASHTARLSTAVAPLMAALRAAAHGEPKAGCQLLAGGNGARIYHAEAAFDRLAQQVATPINWAATLEALVERGVDTVLDLGPGHALADMMHSAFPAVRTYAADSFHAVAGLRAWIATGA